MFRLRKPKPAKTPASQLPNYTDPIEAFVGAYKISYENGSFNVQGNVQSSEVDALKAMIVQLQQENTTIREEKNLLEFKNSLLVDMVIINFKRIPDAHKLTLQNLDTEQDRKRIEALKRTLSKYKQPQPKPKT